MINVQEFARRLGTLGSTTVTSDDIEDLADAAGVRVDPARGIDAGQAQQMLNHLSPPVSVTGNEIVASTWPPPTASRPVAPPVLFSSPGAVDAPAELPSRASRKSGPSRNNGRPDSRRSDSRRSGR
ncbi:MULTISPECIES: hypothetical protein [Actinoplanes]|uniref:Uncharacterized protein n=2 Tax=Actinoplanes TaxID=1865 RepID=A0A101JJ29_9ACTN|nr:MULTISPECIES: hypothetical protein [Actinoplanes]KUL27785.1 hypothetical protein ADL15_33640 [Actinoplanes awajinensis subsp. mycoplanecinus]